MVHRDIKPSNLILACDGKRHTVKILDFGLAKATRSQETQHDLTGDNKMLGTPAYMAPEQAMDATRADIRADIYSLGCALYYLLAGRAPFQAKGVMELVMAHMSAEATPVHRLRIDAPLELTGVIAKMMAKDPAQALPDAAGGGDGARALCSGERHAAVHSAGVIGAARGARKPNGDESRRPAPANHASGERTGGAGLAAPGNRNSR